MSTMRAFVRTSATTGEVTLIERPCPQPGDDEVLVAVSAYGVGVHDRFFIPPAGPFPYTLGTEGAGVVTAIGAAVTTVAIGDRVMITTIMRPAGGTWADFAVAPEKTVTKLPAAIDFATAAGFPIPANAAVETLHTLDLVRGSTLFVGGGSGAIGTLLIQMATRRGLRVAASASAANLALMLSLGAELAVDYNDQTWPDQALGRKRRRRRGRHRAEDRRRLHRHRQRRRPSRHRLWRRRVRVCRTRRAHRTVSAPC